MSSKKHTLKTLNPYFKDIWDKKKLFEIRKNDRDFQVGDWLELTEYENGEFTSRVILAEVIYVCQYPTALKESFVVLGITPRANIGKTRIDKTEDQKRDETKTENPEQTGTADGADERERYEALYHQCQCGAQTNYRKEPRKSIGYLCSNCGQRFTIFGADEREKIKGACGIVKDAVKEYQ